MIRRLRDFLYPRRLPWKSLATRLWIQRNELLKQCDRQQKLLLWVLNEIAKDAHAAVELEKIDGEWRMRVGQNSPGGKA